MRVRPTLVLAVTLAFALCAYVPEFSREELREDHTQPQNAASFTARHPFQFLLRNRESISRVEKQRKAKVDREELDTDGGDLSVAESRRAAENPQRQGGTRSLCSRRV
jgi:hypothetical protein